MTTLILLSDQGPYRLGGLPHLPPGSQWPHCATCRGAMQFVFQLQVGDHCYVVFMCQNDPGLCDEWEADAGGNRALRVAAAPVTELSPPAEGDTTLGAQFFGRLEKVPESYRQARALADSPRSILGMVGGQPDWIQGDETPLCDGCQQRMSFQAQLEQGPDYRYEANFGGGCGYLFDCEPCQQARFLWQQ